MYDARVKRFRNAETGRFVAGKELPWPNNDGFVTRQIQTVKPGKVLDRFGNESGRFFGEPGSTVAERGMAPGTENMQYTRYEVIKPFEMEAGIAAGVPEFGASGGATQYRSNMTVQQLINEGYLRKIP